MDHPYRTSVARWVCIACHRSLSTLAGRCPNCHVDRLDLARPDVREEVRQHAEKMLYRRMMREEMALGAVAMGVGLGIGFVLWLALLERYEDGLGRLPFFAGMMIGIGLRWVLLRVYVRMRPEAGIAVYAARRKRHALTSGLDSTGLQPDQPQLEAGDRSGVDPEVADLDQLLRSLGAKLE